MKSCRFSPFLRAALTLSLLPASFSLAQSDNCAIVGGSTEGPMPPYASASTSLTTGGGNTHLYIATAWGGARASLSNPAAPGIPALSQHVKRPPDYVGAFYANCDCSVGVTSLAAGEASDGSARMLMTLDSARQGGGLYGQVSMATGASAPVFGQQINVPAPLGVAAIYHPGVAKYFGFFSTNSNVLVVDVTSPSGNPGALLTPPYTSFPDQGIQPSGTVPWAGASTLKAANITIGGTPRIALVGATSTRQLLLGEIGPTGAVSLLASGSTIGYSAVLDIANVNNRTFIFSAESDRLRIYEITGSTIVLAREIAQPYNNVVVRGASGAQFPAIIAHRNSYPAFIDIYDTKFLVQPTNPILAKSLTHTGGAVNFVRGAVEAVVTTAGPVVTAHIYRLILGSPFSVHTTDVNISCISADTTSPPVAGATATNLSAAGRNPPENTINYFGDKWRLQDASSSGLPVLEAEWDYNYTGTFAFDSAVGVFPRLTLDNHFFPCDPAGAPVGVPATGNNCRASLSLSNPPPQGPTNFRFGMRSRNANGWSPTPFVSPNLPVVCPQVNILGGTGFAGTCAKTGGTVAVLSGGQINASGSLGNIADATLSWTFVPSGTGSGQTPTVPLTATGFTVTATYPGGYNATATGSITQTEFVGNFSLSPNPVSVGGSVTLTNSSQKAPSVTLNGAEYQITTTPLPSGSWSPLSCGPPFTSGFCVVSGTSVGGTATVTAPGTAGNYFVHVRYSHSGAGSPTTVTRPLTVSVIQNLSINCPATGTVGTAVTCTATTTPPSLPVEWNWESFPVTWETTGTHTYTSPGNKNVNARLVNAPLVSASATINITGPVGGPVNVSVSGPGTVAVGAPANFTAFASGGTPPYTFSWKVGLPCETTFGYEPGTSSYSRSFGVAGPQTVCARATDSAATTGYGSTTVNVGGGGGGLNLSVNGPSTGTRNVPQNFTATASGGTPPYVFSWACVYAGSFSTFEGNGSANPNQRACTYTSAGSLTVGVRVTDATAASALTTAPMTIAGGFTVGITGPTNLGPGAATTFNAVATDGTSPYTYAWKTWKTGDPEPDFAPGAVTQTYTYNTLGTYKVRVRATDSASATTTGDLDLTVAIQPPSAAFTVTVGGQPVAPVFGAYTVEAGRAITFAAGESFASSYVWEWGDNTPNGSGRTVQKSYSAAGSRTLRLVVTGNGTQTQTGPAIATATMTVTPATFRAVLVPGAAHLDQGASVWGTDVTITNPGAGTAMISAAFLPFVAGAPPSIDLSQTVFDPAKSFTLAPGQSRSQADVVAWLNGGNNTGTLVLKYDSASVPTVSSRVYFANTLNPRGASYGDSYDAYKLGANGLIVTQGVGLAGADQTLIGLRSSDLYRFGVTMYNSSGQSGAFRLNALTEEGAQIPGFPRDYAIGPYQQAYFRNQDLGLTGQAGQDVRYILKGSTLSSAGQLLLIGTAIDKNTNDLERITDDNPPATPVNGLISYWVPAVSRYDTGYGAHWRTDFRVFNRSTIARTLRFEYRYFYNGAEREAVASGQPIGPGKLLTFDDIVGSLLDLYTPDDLRNNPTAGVLRISYAADSESSTAPLLISSRNYDDQATGTSGTRLAVYTRSQSIGPGEDLRLAGTEGTNSRTTLGLFAFDDQRTVVRLTALKSDGTAPTGPRISETYVLNAPNGTHFGQVFMSALPGIVNDDTMSIKVEVLEGGRIGAYAFRVDKGTLDTAFFKGEPQQF